jgi:hypothetical protein
MIDKIELRLPRVTPFRPAVREFMAESRHFKNSSRTMGSGRYEWVTNLGPVGIDGLLHYSLKREENDPHEGESKLELLDTGTKGYSDLVAQVEATVESPVDDLDIMRIDLCADMHGVPVEWFLSRLRVRFKRIAHEIGIPKYQRIGKAGIQTVSAGQRPNIVRVYDKVAEYKNQLRKLQRKRSREADELTLEREFGISEGSVSPVRLSALAYCRACPNSTRLPTSKSAMELGREFQLFPNAAWIHGSPGPYFINSRPKWESSNSGVG